jgi:hypothetical protein
MGQRFFVLILSLLVDRKYIFDASSVEFKKVLHVKFYL